VRIAWWVLRPWS